jgi:hypothetical protein
VGEAGRRVAVAVGGRLVAVGGIDIDVGVSVGTLVGVSAGVRVSVAVSVGGGVGLHVAVGVTDGRGVLVGVGVTVGAGARKGRSRHVQPMVIAETNTAEVTATTGRIVYRKICVTIRR